MKFSISKHILLEGLQCIQNVVTHKVSLPILSNILLETDGTALQLTATDLDVSICTRVEASIIQDGSITLPARRFFSIIRELPTESIDFEVEKGNICSISSGQSFFKIFGLGKEEYPIFPQLESERNFVVEKLKLKEAIKKTSYAVSHDEVRYVLNGILFAFEENIMTLVATDGRRLALCAVAIIEQDDKQEKNNFIIPTKTIVELQRLLTDEGNLSVHIGKNLVKFDFGKTILASKFIEGNYPNYRQVIPTEVRERVILEREIFLHLIRRVSLLSNDKTGSVKLKFSENHLEVTSNIPEVGEAKESLIIAYKGRNFVIAFNPEFLLDPLRNITDDTIILELIDEISPGVIKLHSGEQFLYVLMPMRVSI